LDPNLPGYSKYRDAWKDWSEPDEGIAERVGGFTTDTEIAILHDPILLAGGGEIAMRRASKDKKDPEKRVEKAKKATEIAAMVWGIYWAEEVIKAREKKEMKR